MSHTFDTLAIAVVTSINFISSPTKVSLQVSPTSTSLPSPGWHPPQPLPAWSITQPGACQAVACSQAVQGNNRAVFKYGQEAASQQVPQVDNMRPATKERMDLE